MIDSFTISNFKAFGEEAQEIPLKPLTIVFGANSSGKSSILHSLLYAHHAAVTGELDVVYPKIGEGLVDLGGFKQFIHGAAKGLGNQLKFAFSISPAKFAKIADSKRSLTNKILKGPKSTVWFGLLEGVKRIDLELIIHVERDKEGKPKTGSKPYLTSYTVDMNGEQALSAFATSDGTLRFSDINVDLFFFRRFIESVIRMETFASGLPVNPEPMLDEAITPLLGQLKIRSNGFLPESVFAEEQEIPDNAAPSHEPDVSPSAAIRRTFPGFLNELVSSLAHCLKKDFESIAYLAPLRSYPPRHIGFAEGDAYNSKAGGGRAWLQLADNDEVRVKINEWLNSPEKLKTPYTLKIKKYYSNSATKEKVQEHFNKSFAHIFRILLREYFAEEDNIIANFLEEYNEIVEFQKKHGFEVNLHKPGKPFFSISKDSPLAPEEFLEQLREMSGKYHKMVESTIEGYDFGDYYATDFFEVNDPDGPKSIVLADSRTGTEVSHRDVGICISQVLPVLALAFGSKKEILTIEQPEIHLHPSLQAELADVFIESAMGENKNRCLLETHSEHLILRILRRIREESKKPVPKITAQDVAVLYVAPGEKGSEIYHIRISQDGEFIDPWPGGFFPERMEEIFGL